MVHSVRVEITTRLRNHIKKKKNIPRHPRKYHGLRSVRVSLVEIWLSPRKG